ncbi:MAG: hypothetical protein GJ680_07465 [Alteromonadaceae bacterium]|nr:hypothetical protein [Alteromonadaceae bacterium]
MSAKYIIVKRPLNSAFPDKATAEGTMSESEARIRADELNKTLPEDAEFTYKACSE